ncbi:hypothetical protein N7467_001890 [Penicillium canescens]|nr:hypothetical protein N7467_001890 [Penicillium canescens]
MEYLDKKPEENPDIEGTRGYSEGASIAVELSISLALTCLSVKSALIWPPKPFVSFLERRY